MVGIKKKSTNVVASGDPRATEGLPLLCIIVYRCVYSTLKPGIARSAWFYVGKKKKLPCDRRFSAWLNSAMVPSFLSGKSLFCFLFFFSSNIISTGIAIWLYVCSLCCKFTLSSYFGAVVTWWKYKHLTSLGAPEISKPRCYLIQLCVLWFSVV